MTDHPMIRAQTDAWELRRIASKLRAGRQIWLSEEADVLDRIAARAQAAPEDLAALADRLDSEAGIADRPGQLDRLEGIAAQLRAHRCPGPAVEVAAPYDPAADYDAHAGACPGCGHEIDLRETCHVCRWEPAASSAEHPPQASETASVRDGCANCGRELDESAATVDGGGSACSAGCADAAGVQNVLREAGHLLGYAPLPTIVRDALRDAGTPQDGDFTDALAEAYDLGRRDATPSPAVEVGDNGGGDPVALKSKLARSTWNYRVVRQTVDGETLVGVHEAYDGGTSWTTDPVAPVAETVEGLREVLRAMATAPEFAVIDGDAPAPAPAALAVGGRVDTTAQLDALPVTAVVRDASGNVGERDYDDEWRWAGTRDVHAPGLPAVVLDLPTGGDL